MLKKIVIGLVILIGALVGFMYYTAYKISSKTGPYTYEELSKQPVGTEVFVTCPDGTSLRTISAGEGQTVVLAHGFGGSIKDWNLVFEKLIAKGYHVIAFEQRGHNKSIEGKDGIGSKQMAGDYKTILEHFDCKNVILVGHSMGGFLTIKFLVDHPAIAKERLKAVLLLSTFAGNISKDNEQNKMQIPMIEKGYINTILNFKPLGTIFQSTIIGEPYGAIVKTATDNLKLNNYKKLIPILKAFVDEDYYNKLSQMTVLSTVMVGSADKTTPAFHSRMMADSLRGSNLVLVPSKGHLINWEAPDEIVTQIEILAKK